MSIELKAKELAISIKNSDEYNNLSKAHEDLKTDTAAQEIITKIQKLQEQIHIARSDGKPFDSAQTEELEALHKGAGENETLSRLFKAQETFNNLMQYVNEKIGQELYS